MFETINAPTIPFGMHHGEPLRNIPADYLAWILRTAKLSTRLRAAIRGELLSRRDCPELPPEPKAEAVECSHCGSTTIEIFWQNNAGGLRLIRANCVTCRRFVKWLPKTPENIAKAAQRLNENERPRSN